MHTKLMLSCCLVFLATGAAFAEGVTYRGNPLICPIVYGDRQDLTPVAPVLSFDEADALRVFADEQSELKRYYLPPGGVDWAKLPAAEAEQLLAHMDPAARAALPGLLPTEPAVRAYLSACPHGLASDRRLGKGPPDRIVPHAFQVFHLPNTEPGQERVALTRFHDRSFAYGGEYLALLRTDTCPAQVDFLTGIQPSQTAVFATLRNQTYLVFSDTERQTVRLMNRSKTVIDSQRWLTTCEFIGLGGLAALRSSAQPLRRAP